MAERYAIYHAPSTTGSLWEKACTWLGRDAATGDLFDGPVAGVDRARLLNLTQSANRYGFHATIKAPMALVEGAQPEDLHAALRQFAGQHQPVELGRMTLTLIDGFIALVPAAPSEALQDFAAHVVETFDPFRAPMSIKDRAARMARDEDRLRIEHFIHLRCELPSHDVLDHFEAFAERPIVRLASVMDHTPGQRQFQSLETYRLFYQKQLGHSAEEAERAIAARLAEQARYATPHRKAIARRARELGLALASHDDATLAHVEEGVEDGVRISEFPTTLEAAAAAHDAGLAILMGAPNVVRGKSHSGNISATDLVRAGKMDILSSDYVPFALLQAAFLLPQRVEGFSLAQALALVTSNPARAAGLSDRGEIAVGKRADLVRVQLIGGAPVVRAVWRQGQRVS